VIVCDAPGCRRGIVHLPGAWGDPCKHCKGTGVYTISSLARLLGDREDVIRRLLRNKPVRQRTAQRVLVAVMKVLEPWNTHKQKELFE
jgi:hypothetical protein